MTTDTKLLPCPFCGCKAVASINKDESLWSHDVVDWTRVHCTNDECNAQTEATCEGYEPSAIEVWNRRTPQQVAPMSQINRVIAYSAATKLRELGFAWDEEAEAWLNSAAPQPAPAPLSEVLQLLNSFEYESDEDSQSKAFFKAHINEDWFFHVKHSIERQLEAKAAPQQEPVSPINIGWGRDYQDNGKPIDASAAPADVAEQGPVAHDEHTMSNTPSKAEIEALAQQHLKAFVQFNLGEVWFEGEVEFARAVLAKWGTPQPENLGFTIENRAGADVVVWKEGGCRPATSAEIAMWKALSTVRILTQDVKDEIERVIGIKGGQHGTE